MRDVWIVIPAFNEATVISDVVGDVRSVFDNVVCVDDGSRDDTAEQAWRAGAHVVRHPVNLGQGAAIQTGVEYARSRPGAAVFATFDADGQHRIADVIRMIDRLRTENLDIVVGTRFADGTPNNMPTLRRLVFPLIAKLSPASRKLRLTDAHNGLRVLSRDVVEHLDITQNRMAHASELVAQIGEMRLRYGESPVHILYTDYSKSKGQSLWNSVNILVELMFR